MKAFAMSTPHGTVVVVADTKDEAIALLGDDDYMVDVTPERLHEMTLEKNQVYYFEP